MSEFKKVTQLDELEEGKAKSFVVDETYIALAKKENKVYAVSDICPHAGAPLGGGWLEDDTIVCPYHSWRFNLEDGQCPHIKGESIQTYEVKVEENEVFVKI